MPIMQNKRCNANGNKQKESTPSHSQMDSLEPYKDVSTVHLSCAVRMGGVGKKSASVSVISWPAAYLECSASEDGHSAWCLSSGHDRPNGLHLAPDGAVRFGKSSRAVGLKWNGGGLG